MDDIFPRYSRFTKISAGQLCLAEQARAKGVVFCCDDLPPESEDPKF
jgi:hypothetical protein